MQIKSQLRTILGELVAKHPVEKARDRVVKKQTIKHINHLDAKFLPAEARGQSVGGLLRILATDDRNAEDIAEQVRRHQDDLQVDSVHVLDGALDYWTRDKQPAIFNKSVLLKLNRNSLLKSTLKPVTIGNIASPLLASEIVDGDATRQRIVIDFSSPNIAKPFHFGHLKSTLFGNFLTNLYKFVGHEVVKLNYIGDWGTQYGLLNLGLSENELPSEFNDNYSLLRHLVDVYVEANEKGRNDASFYAKAKERFSELEWDSEQRAKWLKIRDVSMEELKKSYARLGIEFDVYEYESDYASESTKTVEIMKQFKFVRQSAVDGHVVAQLEKNLKQFEVPVQRSDGQSLYLTRDIAAAIKRKERYNFDRMLYIVGLDQERHFYSLREIIKNLGNSWHSQLIHVGIGKVLGMSTRKGSFVLLSEIIDNTIEEYIESTRKVVTSKVARNEPDIQTAARHLALSALFISDLRSPRHKNYQFDWNLVVLPGDRTGINIQTTHARLCSLMEKAKQSGLEPASGEELTIDALCTAEAMDLLTTLGELDAKLHEAYCLMDAAGLVNYAFDLCKAINRARRSDRLWVLGESTELWSRTRLALFKCSKERLELLIRLFGLEPLEKV